MNKKYFVIDFKKLKTQAQFQNWILGHNERKYNLQRNNVDKTHTKDNILITECKYKSFREFIETKKREIQELNKQNRQKRKQLVEELIKQGYNKKEAQKIARQKFKKRRSLTVDQAVGFSIVVDCSVIQGWSQEDYISYLKDAEKFLKQRFNNLEILSSIIHLDESKPHLHISFAYWDTQEKKFTQKELWKNKITDLNNILNDFERDIGQKYDLVRGDRVTLQKALINELNKQKKQIEYVKDKKAFGLIKTTKKVKILSPSTTKKIIEQKIKEVKELGQAHKVKETLIKNNELQEKIEELQQENKKLQEDYQELKIKKENLENENLTLIKQNENLKKTIINNLNDLIEELAETKARVAKDSIKAKQIIKQNLTKKYKNNITF